MSDSSLAIQVCEHRLKVRDDGLDFHDDQRPRGAMKAKDVDGTSLAAHVERDLGGGLPTLRPQQCQDSLHQASMASVEQSIESFTLPEQSDVHAGTEFGRDSLGCVHGHAIGTTSFDPADDRTRNASSRGDLLLGQAAAQT